MQANQFKSKFVRTHYVMALEGTNNTLFHLAHTLPILDKQSAFPESLKSALGLPHSMKTMFDYRNQIPAIYNRLFQLCIISLCADIEFFFKALFEEYVIEKRKDRGFFQRFNGVITALSERGFDFAGLTNELAELEQAFMVRHMCVHNFGIVDNDFAGKSRRLVVVGEIYSLDQTEYLRMFDSYRALLLYFDGRLASGNLVPVSSRRLTV